MAPMKYFPHAYCVKCDRDAALLRKYDPDTNQRYIEALCHGETQRINFVDEPGEKVKVFGPPEPKPEGVSVRPTLRP